MRRLLAIVIPLGVCGRAESTFRLPAGTVVLENATAVDSNPQRAA